MQLRLSGDDLPALKQELKNGPVMRLALVVDDLIEVEFLSRVVGEIARRNPALVLEIRTASPGEVEAALAEGEADVIIAATSRILPGVRSALLAWVTPMLLVSRRAAIKSSGHFWQQSRIAERLIYPVETGLLHHTFERGLRAMHVNWRPSIRVNSRAVMKEWWQPAKGWAWAWRCRKLRWTRKSAPFR